MTFKNSVYIIIVITIALGRPAYADSPVWKISKHGQHLFIGGTIHLLSENDYPLPAAFEKAYNRSVYLILEADLQKFKSPEFQKIFIKKMSYSGKRNVKDVLNAKTYQALEKYLLERRIPIANLLKFKPGMLAMILTVIELKRFNLAGIGVDEFFNLKAISDKKKIGYLESIDDQLGFLLKMGKGNANEFISHTLRDMEKLPAQMAAMKKAWRTGDNQKLDEIALISWKKESPELYQTLLVKRNNNWIPKIEKMLQTKEVELILFGALHLIGEDGVLAQLKSRGYTIQKQ
jgi:uncharacterized protein YbaP (TraB family)